MRRLTVLIVALGVLAVCARGAEAQSAHDDDERWVYLYEDGEDIYHVDTETLMETAEGLHVWIRQTWRDERKAKELLAHYYYDCEGRRNMYLGMTLRDHDGSAVPIDNTSPTWRHISPDSRGELELTAVCSLRK